MAPRTQAGIWFRNTARPVVRIDEGGRAHMGLARSDLVRHAHLFQHPHMGRPAEIHRLAAVADRRRTLDHGGLEAVVRQPPGQGRTGDAGAGNQDGLRVRHGRLRMDRLNGTNV